MRYQGPCEFKALLPHHLKLEVNYVAHRHLYINVGLVEEFSKDKELLETFKAAGPGRIFMFDLVRAECWTEKKYTETSLPLSREFYNVLDNASMALLEMEVRSLCHPPTGTSRSDRVLRHECHVENASQCLRMSLLLAM